MIFCNIEGCKNESGLEGTAKGLCRSHYKRLIRYGDPETPLKRIPSYNNEKCSIESCDFKSNTNGLCVNHYAVIRRKTNPEAQRRRQVKFKAKRDLKLIELAGRVRPELCEICQEYGAEVFQDIRSRIVWDHCHRCNGFRGWLCNRCNRVLGSVKDSIPLLLKMAIYLEEHFNVSTNCSTEKKSA